MPETASRYTVDEVLAFPPDGNRYQPVHGALLVTPAPRLRHQIIVDQDDGALHLERHADHLGFTPTAESAFDLWPQARDPVGWPASASQWQTPRLAQLGRLARGHVREPDGLS